MSVTQSIAAVIMILFMAGVPMLGCSPQGKNSGGSLGECQIVLDRKKPASIASSAYQSMRRCQLDEQKFSLLLEKIE